MSDELRFNKDLLALDIENISLLDVSEEQTDADDTDSSDLEEDGRFLQEMFQNVKNVAIGERSVVRHADVETENESQDSIEEFEQRLEALREYMDDIDMDVVDYDEYSDNVIVPGNANVRNEVPRESGESSYKEKQAKLSSNWNYYMEDFVKAYVDFLGREGAFPTSEAKVPGSPAPCSRSCLGTKQTKKVNMFFWHAAIKEYKFEYCTCKTLGMALIEAGMFPLTPCEPKGAIQFGLCDHLINFRNIFAGSAEKIAEVCNIQYKGQEYVSLTPENCSNTIMLYSKMRELSFSMVYHDHASGLCMACPILGDAELLPTDKSYVTMDGNFRMKGRKSREQGAHLTKISGLQDFDDLWLTEEEIPVFHKPGSTSGPTEARNFNVEENANAKSKAYPVRGVFASGCARHDTVFKLVDLKQGEKHKFPLACIADAEKRQGGKLHVMYDVVCKLEPAIKLNFPALAGNGRLALAVFHAYAHVMHCQVLYNPRLIDGFGLTDGEGMERLWSFLSSYITLTKPMIADNRRYVLYMAVQHRNTMIKYNMAKVLKEKAGRLFTEHLKLNKQIDKWSDLKISDVASRYQGHVDTIGARGCCVGNKIEDLVPSNVTVSIKYHLLLSVYIRFMSIYHEENPTVVVGSTGVSYFRQGIAEIDAYLTKIEKDSRYDLITTGRRPTSTTRETVHLIEADWIHFLLKKEKLYKDLLRANVQVYFDQLHKLNSRGHIGTKQAKNLSESLRKQKKQIQKVLKAYNDENEELFASTVYGQFSEISLDAVLKEDCGLWEVNWSKDISLWLRWKCLNEERERLKRDVFWLRENIKMERKALESALVAARMEYAIADGAAVIIDEKLKQNSKWLKFSEHHLAFVRYSKSAVHSDGFEAENRVATSEIGRIEAVGGAEAEAVVVEVEVVEAIDDKNVMVDEDDVDLVGIRDEDDDDEYDDEYDDNEYDD